MRKCFLLNQALQGRAEMTFRPQMTSFYFWSRALRSRDGHKIIEVGLLLDCLGFRCKNP